MSKLYYFNPETEFHRNGVNWYSRMSKSLLIKADVLRHIWGAKIIISPNAGALGRHLGLEDRSQHNIDLYNEVRAMDVFPGVPERYMGEDESVIVEEFLYQSRKVGFTGLGIYPNWEHHGQRWAGFHLDVREDRLPSEPTQWGRIQDDYVSLDKAMNYLEDLA